MHNSGLPIVSYRIVSSYQGTVPGRGLDKVAPILEFHLYALFIYAYPSTYRTVFLWVFHLLSFVPSLFDCA